MSERKSGSERRSAGPNSEVETIELPWPPENTRQLCCSLYIGALRPGGTSDTGLELADALLGAGISIACVLVREDDPVSDALKSRGIPLLPLPTKLCRPRSQIQRSLRTPEFRTRFERWLEEYQKFDVDLGLVFYGWWLPPELFSAPRYGSINFHPAPLPMMRGFEPETAAVLRGMRRMHATIHVLEEDFDTGSILWESRAVVLEGRETPAEILELVTRRGISEMGAFFSAAAEARIRPRVQDPGRADSIGLESVREESVIDWVTDDHQTIDRRARAFNGQKWRVRLRALIEGNLCSIGRIDMVKGDFPGWPGRRIGTYPESPLDSDSGSKSPYAGHPIIRTTEGVAVTVVEHVCDYGLRSCLLNGKCYEQGRHIEPADVVNERVSEALIRAGMFDTQQN